MNWDQLKGKWKQMSGDAKTRWGKLTDDDLKVIGGERDKLVGHIQERYGIQKEQAQREVDDWNASLHHENEAEREQMERKAS
ncbi:MAG TPA: CsbD family protein [Terriglobales bacterium]|nr:CsbD family protein [Terriglobales bacterium]